MLQGPDTQFNDKNKFQIKHGKIIGLNIKIMLKIFLEIYRPAIMEIDWLNNNGTAKK